MSSLRVFLQPPEAGDEKPFLAAMRNSVGLHHPWVTAPKDHKSWKRYTRRIKRETEAGFLIKRLGDGAICGVVNLNIITFDALRSAYTSYFAVAGMTEQGYMKEGLTLLLRYAFDELELHRLEANIQPQNLTSIALAKSVGFRYEGFSPRYLKINGEWCDHERWAVLSDQDQCPI